MAAAPMDVIGFWKAAGEEKWFARSDAFDQALRLRFEATHHAAARGEYAAWRGDAQGALALLLLLDQFPRNLYRGSAHAFATDALARAVAEGAIADGFDQTAEASLRQFFYLPFVHSEDPADQDQGVALYEALAAQTGDADGLKWARIHRDVILRFGRFPHRNTAFGRESTGEELAFLADGGFAG